MEFSNQNYARKVAEETTKRFQTRHFHIRYDIDLGKSIRARDGFAVVGRGSTHDNPAHKNKTLCQ